MPLLLKKEKNNFILKLHKDMYNSCIVKSAVSEDKAWIKEMPVSGKYLCFKLKASDRKDVFDWMNYLLYLHRE